MIRPEVKLIAGVISLRPFWEKLNFISGDKAPSKHYPKWNHMKENICSSVNKNDCILIDGPLISDHPRNEIHFILPEIKSDINKIYFMADWNFCSGIFYFGSHVNNLLYVVQKSEKMKLYLKVKLSSLIKKAWCTFTFLNHFREVNEQLLCVLFL